MKKHAVMSDVRQCHETILAESTAAADRDLRFGLRLVCGERSLTQTSFTLMLLVVPPDKLVVCAGPMRRIGRRSKSNMGRA
jgi:hypothetical protein